MSRCFIVAGNPSIFAWQQGSDMRENKSRAKGVVEALSARKVEMLRPQRKAESSSTKSDAPDWRASFIAVDGVRDIVELGFMSPAPNIGTALRRAFVLWGQGVGQRTRVAAARNLRVGLFEYLRLAGKEQCGIDALDRAFFFGFIRWLNQPRPNMGMKPWAHGTRDALLTPVRTLVESLEKDEVFGRAARNVSECIPFNPWPGRTTKSVPVPRMHMDDLQKVVKIAEAEIERIEKRFLTPKFDTRSSPVTGTFEHCLQLFAERFDGTLPTRNQIKDNHSDLFPLVRTSGWLSKMPAYLYAEPRDLVPFVLLIAVATGFNPETVLSIDRRKVETIERMGNRFVQITGSKNRAHSDQVSVVREISNSGIGLRRILDLLEVVTRRLRVSVVDEQHRNLLFLYSPATRGQKLARGFLSRNDCSTVGIWRHSLQRFILEHGLRDFNLRRARPTLLDEIWFNTGDATVVRSFSQHRSVETLWKHYTSDGTRQRFRERIGETLLLQARWWQSDGRINPRATALPPRMDRGAATPGFLCLDPFDSPRANQRKGALCTAYGECGSCANAAASATDPAAVALYLAMHRAVLDSRTLIAPLCWATKWAGVADDLAALISSISVEVLQKAAAIRTTLPKVG